MRRKNGFTLIEVMAVVVILGIIVALGVGVYRGVTERQREKAYQNKVKMIEMAAEKWAVETNLSKSTTITVLKLIESSYLSADKYDTNKDEYILEDPRNGESLICNTITVVLENGEASATFNDVSDCTLMEQDSDAARIKIAAYTYDIANKKIIKEVKGKSDIKTSLDWTNTAVLLAVEPDSEFADYNKVIYASNGKSNTKQVINNNIKAVSSLKAGTVVDADSFANLFVVDTNLFLNVDYTVSIDVNNIGLRSNSLHIKIDKEPPKAVVSKTAEYTNQPRTITMSGSDGAGSGLKGFYVTKSEHQYNEDEFIATTDKAETKLANGRYYIYAIDNAGNISEANSTDVTNVDQTGPICIIHSDGLMGENDWYIGDVSFSLEYDDLESGVATHTISATTLTTDTTSFKVTARVVDNMGNTTDCELTVKRDARIPNVPTITASDNIVSGNWHKDPFTLTGSGGDNISGNTYYYGLTNNPTSTTKSSITAETSGTTYYVKSCSGAGLCNTNSYVSKLDMTPPSTPTGGSLGGTDGRGNGKVQVPASGSVDPPGGSGGVYYMYLVNTTGIIPDRNDSRFTTSLYYPRVCGTTYYAYAIAVDIAGNRSGVKYIGSNWSFTCSYAPEWRNEGYSCNPHTCERNCKTERVCWCTNGWYCPSYPCSGACNPGGQTCENRTTNCEKYTCYSTCYHDVPYCTRAGSYYNSSTGMCDYY